MSLTVSDLRVEIMAGGRRLLPVDGVSLDIGPRQCVALLGESGCGKSMTALGLMRPVNCISKGLTCSPCPRPRCAQCAAGDWR